MNIKPYGKGMLFVAVPVTLLGLFLAFVTTHSGGALFYFSLTLVPGLWFIDKFDLMDSSGVWVIAISVQVVYWSILVLVFNGVLKSNEKIT